MTAASLDTITHQEIVDVTRRTTMPIKVLLVEDSPGDVRLTQEVLRATNSSVQLLVASDGADAMALLRRQGEEPGGAVVGERPELAIAEPLPFVRVAVVTGIA